MTSEAPLGLFITWTCYGNYLPGDSRGWRDHGRGWKLPQPRLESWVVDQMTHPPMHLGPHARSVCQTVIAYLIRRRRWQQHAFDARSNHCHLVVSANDYAPTLIRDQCKAECTKQLRKAGLVAQGQPVWAEGGWIDFLDNTDDIHDASLYVLEAQDRKGLDI